MKYIFLLRYPSLFNIPMIDGHLELKDISLDNRKAYVEKPDKSFSRQRNYAVISAVLAENDKMQRSIDPRVKENAGNVADILSSFAKYKLDQDGGKQIEEWLGKSWMTRIYGDKLIEKIKVMESIAKLNRAKGNTLFNGYFYTN